MIFNFIVRRLHFLARIPLAPQFFDATLLIWTALFNRDVLRAIELLEQEALHLEGVTICSHRFGGIGFKNNAREFAHIHSNGLLDVELTRAEAEELIDLGRALPHHVFGRSRWITFWLRSSSEVPEALHLLHRALATPVPALIECYRTASRRSAL
jgi:hypothetical protein